ncbi:MAG: hypothetical protein KIT09_35480 [Bryobacteraceae bacterium]|nr:hypothetical protein [Bryobacteraceae bacterium]
MARISITLLVCAALASPAFAAKPLQVVSGDINFDFGAGGWIATIGDSTVTLRERNGSTRTINFYGWDDGGCPGLFAPTPGDQVSGAACFNLNPLLTYQGVTLYVGLLSIYIDPFPFPRGPKDSAITVPVTFTYAWEEQIWSGYPGYDADARFVDYMYGRGRGTGTVSFWLESGENGDGEYVEYATATKATFHLGPGNGTAIGVFANGYWYRDINGDGLWNASQPDGYYSYDHASLFGWPGAEPVLGDWNGDGRTKIGVFKDGVWYLDYNGDGEWSGVGADEGFDAFAAFGWAGVTPVVGDWTGDGRTKIGVFKDGFWYLDMNGNGHWDPPADKVYGFGWAGVTPLVGDWNGDGKAKVGVFKDGVWYLDWNGNGTWDGPTADRNYSFGWPGVTPVIGNWDGTARTKIGVFSDGWWYLDMNGNGVWEANKDRQRLFGWPGVTPMVGDWTGDGRTKVGVFKDGEWYLDFSGSGWWDGPVYDRYYSFGWTGVTPVTGNW